MQAIREDLIVADCTTAEPQSTIRIAGDFAAKGAWFVDIPMTRTPREAEEGRLGLMIAGERRILDRIDPVLRCFADTIVYSGEVGAAHKLKLLNNFLSLGNAALVAEAITVAAKAGVDMKALRDIVISGGANSVMFERLIKVPLEDDDSAAKFAIRNGRKDLRYYTNMTEQLPVTSFLAEAVHQTYVLAETQGYGERFIPRLIDMLADINGLKK
jgi:3-hydroxyisobutyrate dehydrogenase-like beta-hydroxyacid dehydrogenase